MKLPRREAAVAGDRRVRMLSLVAAYVVLALGIWCNTGTLAPYASTLEHPFLWQPCQYPLNIDHFHFKATYWMLRGAPRAQWEFSVVLRRILYPLLAYPAMRLFGYGAGGLLTNVWLALVALVVFWRALSRRLGQPPSPLVLALLATYPGIAYWAGLPYSYAAIVPLALLCQALLWRLDEDPGPRRAAIVALALGVLFTGYDLLPIFGAAALLLLAWRRAWASAAVLFLLQLVPPVLVSVTLWEIDRVPFRNANSEAYLTVLRSYVPPFDPSAWWALLRQLPRITLQNYVFSNFLFLPLLVLVVVVLWRTAPLPAAPIGLAEACVLLAAALLFLFNNLAPPYVGWPLRGAWVARLYQPIVAAMVPVVASALAQRAALGPRTRASMTTAVTLTIVLQAWVVFAPVLGQPWLSGELYWRFYRHAPRPFYAANVERLGARPVGFCASAPSPAASVTH